MTETQTKFNSKVKTRWLLTIFVTIWVAMCLTLISIFAYGFIETPSRIDDLLFIWVFLILTSFIAINYIKWQINGQENLLINNNYIEIYNSGTWFTRKLRINYFEIEDIKIDNDKQTPKWIKLWGIGGGKIIIQYLGRQKRFGQDLTNKEAQLMYDKIKTEFEKRKTNVYNAIDK